MELQGIEIALGHGIPQGLEIAMYNTFTFTKPTSHFPNSTG